MLLAIAFPTAPRSGASLYEFTRAECLDNRFLPTEGSDGALGALPRTPGSSRCLGGIGIGLEPSRSSSALMSTGDFAELLPHIRAAGCITVELWLRPPESEPPRTSGGSAWKLSRPSRSLDCRRWRGRM